METARHDSADRIRIAQLTGVASRHAGLKLREDGSYDQAAAIAELHTVSADPHLLAHAITGTRHWQHRTIKAMLIAAGALPDDIVAIAEAIDERQQKIGFPVGEGPWSEDQE
jgi:hypothetical protein